MFADDIALINAYSIIITAVSTIVLAIITIFYAIETRKMRIGAKAPMLSIQCDYAPGVHYRTIDYLFYKGIRENADHMGDFWGIIPDSIP